MKGRVVWSIFKNIRLENNLKENLFCFALRNQTIQKGKNMKDLKKKIILLL